MKTTKTMVVTMNGYRLDPNSVFCLTACPDDEFYAPLPFFLPLFELILDDIGSTGTY